MKANLVNKELTRRKVNLAYDLQPSSTHEYNLKFVKKIIRGKKVLDIGCWTGQFEIIAQKQTKKIYGIDPSGSAIKAARVLNPDVEFQIGVAEQLPFKDHSFDVVVMFDVIEHLKKGSEPLVIAEIGRVLKPKGFLAISTPSNNPVSILLDPAYFLVQHRHYSLKQLEEFLTAGQFDIISHTYTSGIFRLITNNIELIWKYIFHTKFLPPNWLYKRILKEYQSGGFSQIHVLAQKHF